MKLYDFTVKDTDGNDVSLSDYRGKVVMIVNTATGCGFTPQYGELEDLYSYFDGEEFEILAFPCNQFANQAPGTDEEIKSFCSLRYGITYSQFAKVDVNGENAIPLFKWLVQSSKFEGFPAGRGRLALKMTVWKNDKNYKNNNNIKWNFTKFLINKDGDLVARYEPSEKFDVIRDKISELLGE